MQSKTLHQTSQPAVATPTLILHGRRLPLIVVPARLTDQVRGKTKENKQELPRERQ